MFGSCFGPTIGLMFWSFILFKKADKGGHFVLMDKSFTEIN